MKIFSFHIINPPLHLSFPYHHVAIQIDQSSSSSPFSRCAFMWIFSGFSYYRLSLELTYEASKMKGGLEMGGQRISDTCWLSASSYSSLSSLPSLPLSFLDSLVTRLTSEPLLPELFRRILFMWPQPLGSSTAGRRSKRSIFLASLRTWLQSISELLKGLMRESELHSSVASRMARSWLRESMLRRISKFSRFWRDSSMSASLWKYLASPSLGLPVISLEWRQSVLIPYFAQTSVRSTRFSLCSCRSSSCSSRSRSLRLMRSCLMKDSTSICISCVAMELLSVRATGSGGRLPKSFFEGYSLEGFGGYGFSGFFYGSFFYLLLVLTRVMFLSLPKPATAVLATSCLAGSFFEKVGFETVVVLARFSIDFELIFSGFSSFYFEFWKGRWVLLGRSGSLGASLELFLRSLEAIFSLTVSLMVSRAFLLLVTTAAFLFLSSSLSSFKALGCFLRATEEHSLKRSSAYSSS